jgi:hypothetical protein
MAMTTSYPGLPEGVTNHAQFSSFRAAVTKEEYRRWGRYGPDVPDDLVLALKRYVEEHDLEFTEEEQDAYLARNAYGDWIVITKASGFFKVCARTGLWLPGEVRHYDLGGDRFCEASCYTRFSTSDTQWVRVSSSCRFANYYDRDFEREDVENPPVLGDWSVIGDIKLAEVAAIDAARKALRQLVARHVTFYQRPRNLMHRTIRSQARQS